MSDEATSRSLPGAQEHPAELAARLEQAWQQRGADYQPRTRHLHGDGSPLYTNRLFLQSSPYLRQHAHNPVNWFPWGDEAFTLARELGRPVLLSIGYSTCHWCHVMEEESFEAPEVASYLNEHYIAIKVDREERPDVDSIYMTAVRSMGLGGGWPLNVWLTPAREPFYGGTYFPPRDGHRGMRFGFLTMLRQLRDVYDRQPERVLSQSQSLAQRLRQTMNPPPGDVVVDQGVLEDAGRHYRGRFDSVNGGMEGAPKFPSSLPVRFLFREARRSGQTELREMAELTLRKMAAGGMYDHVAGGFHRYSTDEHWLVPHFEKMLYDNALLVPAYLEAYQVSGDDAFKEVAEDVLRYVEREMRAPEGGFYSATDADSLGPDGEMDEGYFFTWTPAELEELLGPAKATPLAAVYDVRAGGNFEGRNILHRPRALEHVAEEQGLTVDALQALIAESRVQLREARAARPAPLRDEKVLASWNGLMISAFAQASGVLGDQHWRSIAAQAADFILASMRVEGRLRRSYKDGRASFNAYLDDYAFLIAGLLDLFEAGAGSGYLAEAIALDWILHRHYEDREHGAFFLTSDDHEQLLVREKPIQDGAEPCGNSVQVLNLMRLARITGEDRYRARADQAVSAVSAVLSQWPTALAEMLLAVDYRYDQVPEVIVVVPEAGGIELARPFIAELRRRFVPNRVVATVVEGKAQDELAALMPMVAGKLAQDGQATAYLCEHGLCQAPTREVSVFAEQLDALLS
ncbi:MAG: thioredoxin domain-containing protein [Rickettsiales bacterium]|nr:thioredoxin domain-containing protein [Rickettsiales bacterium]